LKSHPASGNEANHDPLIKIGPLDYTLPSEVSDDAGVWCDLFVTRPCACFVSHLTQGDNAPQANGGFVMNVGDAGPKVAKMLKRYRELAKDAIEERTVDGRIEYHLKIDAPPPPSNSQPPKEAGKEAAAGQHVEAKPDDPLHLRWTLHDKHLIVVWGDESPAEIVKRMKSPEPDWLTAVGKDLPIERRAAIVRVDLEAVAAPFAKGDASDQEIAKQIRDTHLRAVTLVTGLGHDDFVSQVLVETDRVAAVLLKTMVDRPLKAEDLAVIPRDAHLAMALRLNPNLIATGLRWLDEQAKGNNKPEATPDKSEGGGTTDNAIDLSEIDVSQAMTIPFAVAEQAITQLASKREFTLNSELCGELAASIGDTWRLYTSPGEGSSIFNGMTGVVRVNDRERLTKLFDKLAARKPPEEADAKTAKTGKPQPETWAVRKTRFAEHDVYYMVRPQGESLGVLTWCLVKNELVCSLSPQNVKAYLLRQAGGSSLADEPAVIEAFQTKQPPTLLVYEDSRAMFRMTYPLMQGWAMVMAGQAGLPTIGCAKSRLIGEHAELAGEAGSFTELSTRIATEECS